MYERLHRRREAEIDRRWGRASGLVKFLSDDPQSTRAWAQGGAGEAKLADYLLRSVGDRAVLLNDLRVPRSRGNIDHVIAAPSGVWIVDAKNYKGKVEQRDLGGWLKTDRRLYVNGRDRSKLVGGLVKQINAVLEATQGADVSVTAALCFVDSDWGLFAKPFHQGGVLVTWPRKLAEAIGEPGPLTRDEVIRLAQTLAIALPPAVST
ncbi:MAG TPA: nuclease-related domain-containing protein [Acidimicrobiales bacterium]|nr:nuclease-related domain-containing protein [Acidimicrobiales bacterium]